MANHSNTQTIIPTTRYQMWLGTSQSNADAHLGAPSFVTDDLVNARAVLDTMARYNVHPFVSVLDTTDNSVLRASEF